MKKILIILFLVLASFSYAQHVGNLGVSDNLYLNADGSDSDIYIYMGTPASLTAKYIKYDKALDLFAFSPSLAVAWAAIIDKPSTFTPATHNHNNENLGPTIKVGTQGSAQGLLQIEAAAALAGLPGTLRLYTDTPVHTNTYYQLAPTTGAILDLVGESDTTDYKLRLSNPGTGKMDLDVEGKGTFGDTVTAPGHVVNGQILQTKSTSGGNQPVIKSQTTYSTATTARLPQFAGATDAGAVWSDVQNIKTEANHASSTVNFEQETEYLVAMDFDLDLKATNILGFEIAIRGLGISSYYIEGWLFKDIADMTDGDPVIGEWTYMGADDTTVTFGGATSLFGQAWTAVDVNGPNFGFALKSSCQDDSVDTVRVYWITITVYYSNVTWTAGLDIVDQSAYTIGAGDDFTNWTSKTYGTRKTVFFEPYNAFAGNKMLVIPAMLDANQNTKQLIQYGTLSVSGSTNTTLTFATAGYENYAAPPMVFFEVLNKLPSSDGLTLTMYDTYLISTSTTNFVCAGYATSVDMMAGTSAYRSAMTVYWIAVGVGN